MTIPLEIIEQNFELKILTLKNICKILKTSSDQIDIIYNDYKNYTIESVCNYYASDDITVKCNEVKNFMNIILSKNFVANLNMILDSLKSNNDKDNAELQQLFKQYNDAPIDMNVAKIDYKKCPNCGQKMELDEPRSEMRCKEKECNYALVLTGLMYDEKHMYTTDGGLAKRGVYETSRHCRYHLDRILAIKKPNIPDEVIGPGGKIDVWLQANNIKYLKLVTCPQYRQCLKDIGETTYNEHIPYIRQVKSNVSPERLHYSEMRSLYNYFEQCVVVCKKLTTDEHSNLKYYPYFIYKIIENILSDPKDERRLRSIIQCIHFQTTSTLVNNDKIWKIICDNIPDLVFKKTDKNMIFI